MRAIEFTAYGSAADVLKVVTDARPPELKANEVLVEVRAASVNPVDCAIRRGYGREVFRHKGQVGPGLFPQRLGRDASGVVRSVGTAVEGFRAGDRVYSAPSGAAQADLIAIDASELAAMPSNLTFPEAAALPFVALTVWNALVGQVGLTPLAARGKRVLVTRGAGGVGSFAIQLLKAWGAHVIATCSTRNVDFVRGLGADVVVDYTQHPLTELARDVDVALDSSFDMESTVLSTLKEGAGGSYISIVSPKLRLIDEFGLQEGTKRGEQLLADRVREQAQRGRQYHWGFMRPDGAALAKVSKLVEEERIRPLVYRVFPMAQIVRAHELCESGEAQGKIVIDLG